MRALRMFLVAASQLAMCAIALAQTTAFTYQGKLTENGNAAAGSYQMQFKLFDAASAGTQQGPTIADVPVTVAGGVFSASLDFGASPFGGADRWLEIAVRHNSGEVYTTLPREQIASSPYAIRTLSAASADVALDSQKLGGIAANQYVTTTNIGANAILNQSGQQAAASFNIGGNGAIAGSLGVGTQAPNGKVSIANAPPWTTDAWGGAIEMQHASAIGWRNQSPDFRQGIGHTSNGLFLFRTQADIGNTSAVASYDMWISNQGRITFGDGLGLLGSPPNSQVQIVRGDGNALSISGYQPYLTFSDGASKSYVQGVGNDLVLKAASGNNVVVKSDKWTTAMWNGVLQLDYFSAIGWKNNVWSFGMGQQADGLFVFASESPPGQTAWPPVYLFEISNGGNVYQPRSSGGLAKAMVIVDKSGNIIRCFNGVIGSSVDGCGFTVSKPDAATFNVDMGFSVADRFALVNTDSAYYGAAMNYISNVLQVYVPNVAYINFFTIVVF